MEIIRPQRKSSFASASAAVPTIPLYRSAPDLEVQLEEFELYAIQRLRGLFPSLVNTYTECNTSNSELFS